MRGQATQGYGAEGAVAKAPSGPSLVEVAAGAGRAETSDARAEPFPGVRFGDEALVQYERIASRMLLAGEAESFTVAITSPVSGEGVSTACVGVALALATSTSKSVVLLDANLRRPALHDLLGLPHRPGLHEVVAGNENYGWRPDSTELFGALGPDALLTAVPNLWLVPSGAPMRHPAQLTTSEGAKTAIRGLRARFDFVVIDCPPVLSAVDATSICRLADDILLVVQAGVTPRDDIVAARELLRDLPIMGVVLNGE